MDFRMDFRMDGWISNFIFKTCSVECVKQHKIEENCSGKRNPAEKIDKRNMGERMLLSG